MAIGIIPYYISHSSIQELTALINENGLLVDRNYQSLFLMLCILNSVVLLIEYAQEINIFFKTGIVAIIVADIFIIARVRYRKYYKKFNDRLVGHDINSFIPELGSDI